MADQKLNNKNVLREAVRRTSVTKPVLRLEDTCFPAQLDFIKDQSKFKLARCSRRAGKTSGIAFDLMHTAHNIPGVNTLYITLSRKQAKKIIWRALNQINTMYELGGHPNNQELTITFRKGTLNESVVYVDGCKGQSEIEKFRGQHYIKAYIDEAQAFKSYIYELIDDVLEPALRDYDGQLAMTGTPNAACAGAFFQADHNLAPLKGFSRHFWTQHDNPWLQKKSGKPVEQLLYEKRKRKNIKEDDPSYRREDLGQWVKSIDSIVYKYDPARNTYNELPTDQNWQYVLGIDLGWHDADAMVVMAFSEDLPEVYVVEEFKASKQDITGLAEKIKEFDSRYKFAKRVIDTGGLGKKITEELRARHHISLQAAEKSRKLEFIELMNDDLRRSRILIRPDMELCEEWSLLQWDDSREIPREDSRFDNHLADAALYAWREAKHYTYIPEEDRPQYGTREWYEFEMQAEEDREMSEWERRETKSDLTPEYDLEKEEWWEK